MNYIFEVSDFVYDKFRTFKGDDTDEEAMIKLLVAHEVMSKIRRVLGV